MDKAGGMERNEVAVSSLTAGSDAASLSNFRSGYYGALGVSGAVEKKSLESILKEEPADLQNLVQFCLVNALPPLFRPVLWKILFGVLPLRQDVQDFVWQTRLELFSMLRQSVHRMVDHDQFIKRINPSGPTVTRRQLPTVVTDGCLLCQRGISENKSAESPADTTSLLPLPLKSNMPVAPVRCLADNCNLDSPTVLLLALLLRNHQLLCSTPKEGKLINPGLYMLAQFLLEIFEDEVNTFWCLTGFENRQKDIAKQFPLMAQLLEKCLEDEDMAFFEHLQHKELWPHIPFLAWFNAFFSDVASEVCLLSVLDRVAAGCLAVLVYVAAGLLLTVRRMLLSCTGPSSLTGQFEKLSPEVCQTAVQRGFLLWEQHGFPLLPQDALSHNANSEMNT